MNQVTSRGGNQLEYRGMIAQIVFHADYRMTLYGILDCGERYLTFEAQDVDGIVDAFCKTVDGYLNSREEKSIISEGFLERSEYGAGLDNGIKSNAQRRTSISDTVRAALSDPYYIFK
jgi:hypothetical protein